MLDGPRRPAVIAGIGGNSLLAVSFPQVADHGHLHVVGGLQFRHDQIEVATTASDADVSQRNPVIGADNVPVRQRRAGQDRATCQRRSGSAQEGSAIDLPRRFNHGSLP